MSPLDKNMKHLPTCHPGLYPTSGIIPGFAPHLGGGINVGFQRQLILISFYKPLFE